MALPKVNEVLNFTMTVPSTGKTVKYRPYLVKEEKVLLQAFESKDVQACLRAISDTIDACLDPREDIKVAKLATFDIEYMFTQIRSKSVGETWKGYLEDRRPASNANPYCILNVICESLEFAKELDDTLHVMYNDVDTNKLNEKYGAMSNEELLSEYMTDEMEITNNTLYSNGN